MISSSDFPLQILSDSADIIVTLRKRREDLQHIAAQCISELNKIETALSVFTKKPGPRLNWTREVLHILKSCNQPQKTTYILEKIFEADLQQLDDPEKRRLYITGLSVALMNLVKKGVIKSIKVPGEKGKLYTMAEMHSIGSAKEAAHLKAI